MLTGACANNHLAGKTLIQKQAKNLMLKIIDSIGLSLSIATSTNNGLDVPSKGERQMKLKMFSIRDSKAEVYNPPFYKNTHGEAERDFRSLANDNKSLANKYPEDFDLYHIGEYDDNSGVVTPLDTPQHLLKAISCIIPKMDV